MGDRVRIADIAEELGLSTATVSNVIHGKTKKISEETVKRVQELLEEKKYIPNMAAVLLAQNSSKIIGVVVHNHEKYEGHVLEDGFIASSLNYLADEMEENGYFMMVRTTKNWNDIARFASMWNMEGLVLIGFCEQDYQSLRECMHIPFVVYDGFLENPGRLSNIVLDDYGGGKAMGAYLKRMGHEKVLCISDNDTCMDLQRFLGLKAGMEDGEDGKTETEVRLMLVPMEQERRHRFYQEHLEEIRRHTAVFAVSDVYAIELMYMLRAQGIAVPEEISVAGFDDIPLCRQIYPALTTIRQDGKKRARLALQMLKELKRNEGRGRTELLSVELVERGSVAVRRPAG